MLTDAVDPVVERIAPVRNACDHVAHHALGLILHPVEVVPQILGAVFREELTVTALTDRTRGKLRAHVPDQLHRHACVLFKDAQQHLVRLAGLVELHDRQANSFLENLGRVDGGGARCDAADVAMMRHRAGPAFDGAVMEDRLHDVEVGQVLPAGAVRVVIEINVTRLSGRRVISHQDAHPVRERAELNSKRQPLRDELPRRSHSAVE
jgi:hypothetical protein